MLFKLGMLDLNMDGSISAAHVCAVELIEFLTDFVKFEFLQDFEFFVSVKIHNRLSKVLLLN